MDAILRQDIWKLRLQAEKANKDLGLLRRNHEHGARGSQQNPLLHLIEGVQRVESDVVMMLSDCKILCNQCQEDRIMRVNDCLCRALYCMNALFNDLKGISEELHEPNVHLDSAQSLLIDWSRMQKSINQIQKHLKAGGNLSSLVRNKKISLH